MLFCNRSFQQAAPWLLWHTPRGPKRTNSGTNSTLGVKPQPRSHLQSWEATRTVFPPNAVLQKNNNNNNNRRPPHLWPMYTDKNTHFTSLEGLTRDPSAAGRSLGCSAQVSPTPLANPSPLHPSDAAAPTISTSVARIQVLYGKVLREEKEKCRSGRSGRDPCVRCGHIFSVSATSVFAGT